MAGLERRDIGLGDVRYALAELAVQPIGGARQTAVIHPADQPQRPHILAAQAVALADLRAAHRFQGQARNVDGKDAVFFQAAIFERVALVAGFLKVLVAERARIDDYQPARLDLFDIDDQRRRVEGDEHVGRIARGQDRARAEIDLKRRDAVSGADRGADFGGKIRKCLDILSGDRRRLGEAPAGQLDAVSRIAGKTNHHRIDFLALDLGQLHCRISIRTHATLHG